MSIISNSLVGEIYIESGKLPFRKSEGRLLLGGIYLARSGPTLTKNSLNLFAISSGSSMIESLDFI